MTEIAITVNIPALDRIAACMEASSGGSVATPSSNTPAKKGAKKKTAKRKSEHTAASLTVVGKEIIKLSGPPTLRAVLDEVIGKGVKISEAPEDKFDDMHDAMTAKLEELKAGAEEEI